MKLFSTFAAFAFLCLLSINSQAAVGCEYSRPAEIQLLNANIGGGVVKLAYNENLWQATGSGANEILDIGLDFVIPAGSAIQVHKLLDIKYGNGPVFSVTIKSSFHSEKNGLLVFPCNASSGGGGIG